MNSNIDLILQNPAGFLSGTDNSNDIVAISTRVRLARNIHSYVFPSSASVEELKEIRNHIDDIFLKDDFKKYNLMKFFIDEMSLLDQKILFERRLASNRLIADPINRALYCSENESISIMVNEEDHLRIQSFSHGFHLKKVYDVANQLDDEINKYTEYAYNSRLGYLTTCPSNVGTGLRASLMLHLVGLQINGDLDSAIRALNKLNFAVRGIYGEGSKNLGSLYQISNQLTFGRSEEELISHLQETLEQIIGYELSARESLFKKKQYQILDYIGRSYGLLKHAYILEEKELINALSGVKLGVDMGIFSSLDIKDIHEILISTPSASIQKIHGDAFENIEAEKIFRASLVRDKLRKGKY